MDDRSYKIILSLVEGMTPADYWKILDRLQDDRISVGEFFQCSDEYLSKNLSLSNELIKGIRNFSNNLDGGLELIHYLSDSNIDILIFDDDLYPQKLKENLVGYTPPVLYCYGNMALLSEKSGAVVGSRQPDDDAIDHARKAAAALVKDNRTVVSGCAKGIDAVAHQEALDAGGNTIGVLRSGILHNRAMDIFQDFGVSMDSILLISEFQPTQKWDPAAPLIRNKTICALSDLVIIIQGGLRSGTVNTGNNAIKLNKPLFVLTPPQSDPSGWEGNENLISRGAMKVPRDSDSGYADFDLAIQNLPKPRREPEQGTFF